MRGSLLLGAGVAVSALLLPITSAAAEPVVERGGGDSGTVGTEIVVPGTAPRSETGGRVGASPASNTGTTAPCTYKPLTPAQALAAGLLSPDDGGVDNLPDSGGSFVLRDCTPSGGGRLVMWVPDAQGAAAPGGVVAVTPGMLAQEARNLLRLPTPDVGVNPDGSRGNPALVHLPTWWWVSNGDALTQRTSLGTVWAEVTAEPASSVWVAGDGQRSECAGLGMAYVRGMSELEPGSCSHTYAHADADEQAEIQVVWDVSWVGSGGTGGTLEPITLTATRAVPVYERHAIVTSSG